MASQMGHLEAAKLLIAARADVNARSNIGATPLINASEHGNVELVKALIAAKAFVNAKTEIGQRL